MERHMTDKKMHSDLSVDAKRLIEQQRAFWERFYAEADKATRLFGVLGGVFREGAHDGKISAEEFIKQMDAISHTKLSKTQRQEIHAHFGDGLTPKQLAAERLPLIERPAHELDRNHDGKLSLAELKSGSRKLLES